MSSTLSETGPKRGVFFLITFFFILVIARHGGFEYIIPPLYKRLLAEFIDFMLLFILKLIVTFIAVDMFELM